MRDSRIGRSIIGLGLIVSGAWIFANAAWYRSIEALASERVVDLFLGTGTFHEAGSSVFFIGLGSSHRAGLDVTGACSTAVVAAAGLIITGFLIGLARTTVSRSFLALGTAVGVVVAVNILRLVVLAWSASNWGLDGWFEWAHLYGGSLISMVAIAAACAGYLRLLRRSPSNFRHRA